MKQFGLIGFPLDHSFSPAYFKEKFQREGLTEYSYELFPLSSIELLPELFSQHPDLDGFNVTIPYKEVIIPYLDELDEAATEIGAVNCVKIQRNTDKNDNCQLSTVNCQLLKKNFRLKGFNTDAPAFVQCIQEGWNLPKKSLIFGTGGAAKAVAFALRQLNIDYLFVSRNKKDEHTLRYADLDYKLLNENKLWINTSPLGMYPNNWDALPLDYSVIGKEHFLFDLIYNPEETVFLQQGRTRGAQTKNGLAMLHRQADLSLRIFLGH